MSFPENISLNKSSIMILCNSYSYVAEKYNVMLGTTGAGVSFSFYSSSAIVSFDLWRKHYNSNNQSLCNSWLSFSFQKNLLDFTMTIVGLMWEGTTIKAAEKTKSSDDDVTKWIVLLVYVRLEWAGKQWSLHRGTRKSNKPKYFPFCRSCYMWCDLPARTSRNERVTLNRNT